MPFFKNKVFNQKNNMQNCASLQVQSRLSIKNIKALRKRAFLFTSYKVKGSMTIEAAIVISVFIYATFAIMHFMILFNYEINMQIAINNIARDASKKVFYINMIKGMSNSENTNFLEEIMSKAENKLNLTHNSFQDDDENVGENVSEIAKKAIDISYFYTNLASKIGIKNLTDKFVNLAESRCDLEAGMIDIIVNYYYHYPFFLSENNIKIVQRARMKAWNGCDITNDINLVYITANGSVYHTNKQCKHLELNITQSLLKEINVLRNKGGGKYKPCKVCVTGSLSDESMVYVTDYGNNYHTTLECSGLTRKIITIDISQVGDRPLCSDCGKEEK